ncbi:MAG: carboxypeptidase regulatory-like domain-containing protein [Chloroflexota bacterium]
MNTCAKTIRTGLFVLFLLLGLTACNGAEPTSTAVVEVQETEPAAPTAEPTETPAPTSTPTPGPTDTPTPVPTDTPTPTPEPAVTVLVTDEESGAAVGGATVELSSSALGASFSQTTDAGGQAVFLALPEGNYIASVSAEGYATFRQSMGRLTGMVELTYQLKAMIAATVTADSTVLRSGPGSVYANLGTAEAGDVFEVIGQNDDASWLVVAFTGGSGMTEAWIAGDDVDVSGSLEKVAVAEVPPTPAPVATLPPVPTATVTPDATPDFITLYYVSNPNDILGTFPVRPFDGNAMYDNMVRMQLSLNTMAGALPGARAGDAAACASYVAAYNSILNSGIFYEEVPADWEEIDFAYVLSFIYSLDRTRPAYLSCVNSGQVDQFNHDLAYQTINQTLGLLNPTIAEAGGRLGR